MRLSSVTLLTLFAVAAAIPVNTFRFETDDFSNEQSLEVLSNAVTGHYTFMTPEGIKYFVRYIADSRGFRILESNALPQRQPSATGRALGNPSRRFTSRESNEVRGVRGQQRSNAFRTPSRRFTSIESNEVRGVRGQQRSNAFGTPSRRFTSIESNEVRGVRGQQRSRQALGNVGVQQRSRQAFGTPSRRFTSRESNELFDSDERFF